MKRIIAMTTATAFFAMPGTAETSAEEYFAMSNNSAAERLIQETSVGDVTEAEVKFALSNMSAAEREVFFDSDEPSRMELLIAQRKLMPKNSPAEAAAAASDEG